MFTYRTDTKVVAKLATTSRDPLRQPNHQYLQMIETKTKTNQEISYSPIWRPLYC